MRKDRILDEGISQVPRSLPPLTALRAFEVAARLSSFTRAAKELHVTPAAVSHQIRGLETYLGVTLFKRTTRHLELTDQGRLAAEQLREGFELLAHGVDQLRARQTRASLVVSVTNAFATRWLVPRLGAFAARHPSVDVRLRAGGGATDFDLDEIDIAVRIGSGAFGGAVAVPLFDESVVPVASPALLRERGLRRVGRSAGWPMWIRAAKVRNLDITSGMHFDDGHLVLQAAAAGYGVALGRLTYAVDDLAARHLRIPFGPLVETDLKYYLLLPEARAGEPSIDAFRAWIVDEGARFRTRLRDAARGAGAAVRAGANGMR
ncbi:MAG TPA: transcriptional regulator GcvA [Gammaproteobacteria bacterium]|nr:transcriptional regulator GcvA [Gammaproteobacteria bacterium]